MSTSSTLEINDKRSNPSDPLLSEEHWAEKMKGRSQNTYDSHTIKEEILTHSNIQGKVPSPKTLSFSLPLQRDH